MITEVLCNIITQADLGLVEGTTLFADKGSGEQRVVVKALTPRPVVEGTLEVRVSNIQVIVQGWTLTKGKNLAEDIVAALDVAQGDFFLVNDGRSLVCHVYGVKFTTLPAFVSNPDEEFYTINGVVSYRVHAAG